MQINNVITPSVHSNCSYDTFQKTNSKKYLFTSFDFSYVHNINFEKLLQNGRHLLQATTTILERLFPTSTRNQSAFYALKAIVVVALLYLFGHFAETFHPLTIAIIWVFVSVFMSIAFAYPYIIKKKNTKEMFQDYSEASKRINGRFGRLIFSFVLCALLSATLMIESQKWAIAEWAIVIFSIPLYYFVSLFINRTIISKQYKPVYQRRGTMLWSQIGTGVLLTIVFLIVGFAYLYGNSFSLGESFSNTKLLFENSPSALLAEVGKIGYLVDGFTTYGLSQLGTFDYVLYLVISLLLCISSSFALSHLLSLCSLEMRELKKVFLPIEEKNNTVLRNKTIIYSILTLIAISAIFVGMYMYGEEKTAIAKQTNTYTAVEELIREQANLTTYEIDGRLYDKGMIDETINSLIEQNQDYRQKRDALVNSINSSYDTCVSNVDTYLDWYYRPLHEDFFGVIQQNINNWTNANNDRAYQEYKTRITNGINQEQFETDVKNYNQVISNLESQVKDDISGSQLNSIPPWLATQTCPFENYFQTSQLNTELPLNAPQGNYTDREAYKTAILQAIEDSRNTLLSEVQ